MKILHVVGELAPERCGVAHYAVRLVEELNRIGAQAGVASCIPTAAPFGVPFIPVAGFPGQLRGLVSLLVAARRWRADVLHLQYAPSSYDRRRAVTLVPLLARLIPRGPKVVTTFHEYGGWPVRVPGAIEPVADRLFGLAEQVGWLDREALTLLSASDAIVATNDDHVNTLRARSKVLARRARVIPIGSNVNRVEGLTRREARRGLGIAADVIVAVFFGFVHPVKGIETLLRAMRLARAREPKLRLSIVGGVESLALRGDEASEYERKVRQLAAELDLEPAIELTGYVSDREVARRLRAADIAILPFNRGVTLKSGTLITALTFGLPTIATIGGQLGDVRHGESIWLVPPRDPESLAEAMAHLAGDGGLRRAIGNAAAACSTPFDWDRIAAAHCETYQNLLGQS